MKHVGGSGGGIWFPDAKMLVKIPILMYDGTIKSSGLHG